MILSNKDIRNPLRLITLFLLPGIIITISYGVLASPIIDLELPNIVILSIVGLLVLVPIELSIILFASKREFGYYSVKQMIGYQNKLPIKKYLWLVPAIFVWTGIIIVLGNGLNEFIRVTYFSWVPDWFLLSTDYMAFEKWKILLAFVCALLITGIFVPIVEEIYFRGFLLPRMEWMGKLAPLVNAFLFSMYHFFSPWQTITRTVALLPLCYVSYKTKNIKIAIIVHCLGNIIGDAIGLLIIAIL